MNFSYHLYKEWRRGVFFFSSRRRHTRCGRDWSSDVCSSDLEAEKFDVLPAPTYVKGFLRNYADALGLEGQLYVDEYNSRFVTGEEDVPLRPRDYQRRPQPLGPRFEARAVLLAVGGIAVVVALVIGG